MDDIILFHKKHHNVLLIIEVALLLIISFFMSILIQTQVLVLIDEAYEIQFSGFQLRFVDDIFNYIPFIVMVLELIFILVITFIKNKIGNAIFSKKLCHVLFYISIGAIVLDLFIALFCGPVILQNTNEIVVYDNLIGRFVTTMCQVFVMIDIYFWRENFGLEKLYG